MSNVNKQFLVYFDANDLGEKSNEELAEIRAAFVAGYNCCAGLIDDLKELTGSLDAPSLGDLSPHDDIVHDYYQQVINKIYNPS